MYGGNYKMKKLLCFVLSTMLFLLFACKQNVENGGKEKPTPKDTSLKQLIVEQIGGETQTFNSPIEKTLTITLSKKVSDATAFTLKITPKEEGVEVFFDGVKESGKTKTYVAFKEKIKIELKAENSTPTTYLLTIKEPNNPPPADDATLQKLVIKQVGSTTEQSYSDPIAQSLNVTLTKKISPQNKLRIEATPKNTNANVYFNTIPETSKTKEYTTSVSKIVIKVEKGTATKEYTLNITEPDDPELTLSYLKVFEEEATDLETPKFNVANDVTVVPAEKVIAKFNYGNKTNEQITVTVAYKDGASSLKVGENELTLSVAAIEGKYKAWNKKITVTRAKQNTPTFDSTLKKLEIKQGTETIKSEENDILLSHTVQLLKEVSSTEPLMIKTEAKETEAKVYFANKQNPIDTDWEEVKQKSYANYEAIIKIKCVHGVNSTIYTIVIEKPAPANYNVVCNVVDSVGGSNVEGVSVKAYLTGTQTEKGEATTNISGNAYFSLETDKAYDFVLSKKGRAASRVENAYIKQNEKRVLPIVMKEWQAGSKKIAPEINKIFLLQEINSNWKRDEINDGFSLDISALADVAGFLIPTFSKSGEIIPEKPTNGENPNNNNLGIGMSIGSPFRHDIYGWDMDNAIRLELNNKKEKVVYEDGGAKQLFVFNLGKLLSLDGDITLYFIAYDMAGNRCERQQRIRVINGGAKNEIDASHHFEIFQATSKRYYRSLSTFGLGDAELFGMPTEEGTPTSLDVEFKFKLNQKISIGRVDVMRREYQEGNIQDGWECVYTKQYSTGGGANGDKYGTFWLNDDSGTLEEGKTYQYKLVAYGKDGKITSNVATIRVMEAFNVLLTSPAPRATINKNDIENQDFSFKISNPSLWNRERADYFSFGVLVVKDQCREYIDDYGQTQYYGLCFASKLKYDFTKTGDAALLIAGATTYYDDYDYKVFNTLSGTSSISFNDVFKYENGNITLKRKFFANSSFNTFGGKTLKDAINEGGIYYWDVPNMSKFLLKGYDRGVAFVKEYPYLDATTGAEVIGAGKSESSSYSNLDYVGGAINGRAVFTVKY